MKGNTRELLGPLLAASEAVLAVALLVAAAAWGGVWLDHKLHTGPWLAVILTFATLIGGFVSMIAMALRIKPSSRSAQFDSRAGNKPGSDKSDRSADR